MENIILFLTAYGNSENNDKGIIKLNFNKNNKQIKKEDIIHLDGKSNMIIENDVLLITSLKSKEGNYLEFFDKKSLEKIYMVETDYFYSYGQISGDYLLLASFEKGIDSVFDLNTKKIISNNLHIKSEKEKGGRSHYIKQLDKNRIIAVENMYDQLYVYKNINLEVDKVITFENKSIRLISFHPKEDIAYLNTENTNELIVLDTINLNVVDSFKLTDEDGSFSGGNAISENGEYLFISMRGENTIYIFKNDNNCKLHYVGKKQCGEIPRDLKIVDNYLFVTCSNSNLVEVYEVINDGLNKITQVEVFQPITFSLV